MNEAQRDSRSRLVRGFILGGALLVATLGGAWVARFFSLHQEPSQQLQTRPIVQIVRQQPGLPDLADLVDRLCPSVAMIVPHGSGGPQVADGTPMASAFAVSADGWLVTSANGLPPLPLDAVFGDGRSVNLTDARTDPVSGLTIVKAAIAVVPLPFDTQGFPRVGQFGIALATPAGTGCSGVAAMIGSDFMADGGGPVGYVRLRPPPDDWRAGMPLVGTDGQVLGIGVSDPPGGVIPAPIASVILDELIRNSQSATASFGFRAIDYAAPFSARLGDVRSGAGIALVQPKSAAARADLQAGDIVTAVDNVPVSGASELSRALDRPSNRATLTIQRRLEKLDVKVSRNSR